MSTEDQESTCGIDPNARRAYIREVTKPMALDSLRSVLCPACGQGKPSGMSLCRKCFEALPTRMKERLYLRMGKGYEAAIRDALNELHCSGMHLPHPKLSPAAAGNQSKSERGA